MMSFAPMTRLAMPLLVLAGLSVPVAAGAQGLAGEYLGARFAELSGDISMAARLYPRAAARDPQNPELIERAMLYRISSGDVPGAIELSDRLAALAPDNNYVSLVAAVRELRAGAFASALDRLNGQEDLFGPLLQALMKGWAQSVDDMTAADLTFDGLSGNDTLEAYGSYHKALAHAVAGDLEGAAKIFTARRQDFLGLDRRSLVAEAEVYAATGRQTQALEVIDNAFARGLRAPMLTSLRERISTGEPVAFNMVTNATEGVAEALYTFALVLGTGEQNRGFAVLLSRFALYLRPELIDARLLTAELLEDDDQFDLAIAAYGSVPAEAPQFLRAEVGRASALDAAGRTDEAIGVLTGLKRTHPQELAPVTALADALRKQERFSEAAEAYTDAIALLPEEQPRHWVFFYQRGICFEQSDQWDKAEADFRHALALQPDQPLVLNYLGYSLVEKGEKMDEAEQMIRSAVDQRPDDGYITDSLAWVLYKLGRYDEAIEPMERAVELVPSDPILNDHLGDVLWKVGRKMEARFQWKRALSYEPEQDDIARIRRKLEFGLDSVLKEEMARHPVKPDGKDG
ncbi:tetratricopeptide repeat protein [Paroceanicella profunda]|uniref:Tetratricopeptide repeat protein n=2 Tax=Paroceanicella profunda TaxID=2579971 RepID=A0A5B8FHG9_9RHOB|nr:tetratricopeptide repeat protein [Paroceanicella profunda]